MKIRSSLPLGAFTIAVLFMTGSALAAGNYAFSSPQGWSKVRSGTTSKWVDPTGTQALTLFPTEFTGDLNAFVTRTLKKERAAYPSQHVWTNRNYYICGGHTGHYVIWTASSSGRSMIWEQMLALWGYDAFIVTYTRPEKSPPSSIARGSLLSICGVGSAPVAPGGVPVTPQNNAPPAQPPVVPAPDATDQPAPNPTGTISHPYMPVTQP
jgi:hypothetical protein